MALPSADLVKVAVETLYSAFANDKTSIGSRQGVEALSKLAAKLNVQYTVVDIVITGDADDAGVSEFVAAEATISVGTVLRKGGTAAFDLTDDAFATAKGSALAANDIFVISGADAVVYLTNSSKDLPFDFAGETVADFVSIGS